MQPATASGPPPLQPFHFGSPQRRLFGIWHPPAAQAIGQAAVLLCNPFGQEALRAHRMLRVLADRLARAGHAVLRFDYFGTGDSMGHDLDADLDGWLEDVRTADRELQARSGAAGTAWIGMRLGATLASAAASMPPDHLRRLVLWDPILDGARYLDDLRRSRAATLERAFDLPPSPSPPQVVGDVEDAIGFALSRRFRDQLERIRPGDPALARDPLQVVAVCETGAAAYAALAAGAAREPHRVRLLPIDHGIDWTADEAGDSALVPAAALQCLVREAGAAA